MERKRYPKEVVLKDCQEVILRTVEPDDAADLARAYEQMQLEFNWFLKEDPRSLDVIKKWIASHQKGNSFSIVATCKGRIVGHASLLMRPHGGRAHVARLRVMVAPDLRGKGLGTWMLFDLTKRAMEMGMEKIRADFVVGVEDRAIRALQKMGFVREAVLRDYLKSKDGRYHDYQIMIKDLQQEWSDF